MLLRGEPGLRLEPMAEVRDAAGEGPLLHDFGDRGRDSEIELAAESHGFGELGVDLLRQLAAHLARAEGVDAEVGGWRGLRARCGDVGDDGRTRGDGAEGGGARSI